MSTVRSHPDHSGFLLTDQLEPALESTFVRKQYHELRGVINPHGFLTLFYSAVHYSDWCSYIFLKFVRLQRLTETESLFWKMSEEVWWLERCWASNAIPCPHAFFATFLWEDTFKLVILLVPDYGYGEGTDTSVRSRKTTRLLFLELS